MRLAGLFSQLEKLELWNNYGSHMGENLIKQLLGFCFQVIQKNMFTYSGKKGQF
jgi:hypothetical protein